MKSTKTVESYGDTAAQRNRTSLKSGVSKIADPLRINEQNPKDKPMEGKGVEWDFRCPCYDQRSGNFVNAGTHYGIGRNQPVGHKGNPTKVVSVLPQNRIDTMQDDDKG